MYCPSPQNFPFSQVPIYLSPFLKNYIPKPCFTSCSKIPSKMLPSNQKWPLPSFFPLTQFPSQQIPSAEFIYFPCPSLSPLIHQPQQRQAQLTNEPFPFLLLSLKLPSKQFFPFENSFPKPIFQFFFSSHSPIQSFPLKYQTILVKGNLFNQNIIQFLNFFRMQSYKSCEVYFKLLQGSTFKIKSIISQVGVEYTGLLGTQGIELIVKSLLAFFTVIFSAYRIRLMLFKSIVRFGEVDGFGIKLFFTMVPPKLPQLLDSVARTCDYTRLLCVLLFDDERLTKSLNFLSLDSNLFSTWLHISGPRMLILLDLKLDPQTGMSIEVAKLPWYLNDSSIFYSAILPKSIVLYSRVYYSACFLSVRKESNFIL